MLTQEILGTVHLLLQVEVINLGARPKRPAMPLDSGHMDICATATPGPA
jgi:hypothetical protein